MPVELDERLTDAQIRAESGFDFLQLDPVTAQLYLPVQTTAVLQFPALVADDPVTGAIHERAGLRRITDELTSGELGVAEVTQSQTGATDQEFAFFIDVHRRPVGANHVDVVSQRAADGNSVRIPRPSEPGKPWIPRCSRSGRRNSPRWCPGSCRRCAGQYRVHRFATGRHEAQCLHRVRLDASDVMEDRSRQIGDRDLVLEKSSFQSGQRGELFPLRNDDAGARKQRRPDLDGGRVRGQVVRMQHPVLRRGR